MVSLSGGRDSADNDACKKKPLYCILKINLKQSGDSEQGKEATLSRRIKRGSFEEEAASSKEEIDANRCVEVVEKCVLEAAIEQVESHFLS
ncbi:hypothetical protein CEXT_191221 [Caerostris extrusa]|uniref:Uncharacterized protein n=1 Tax=Caerostris extrusa TaxID=172846 RepID=A0AAV4N5E0_CAEEX|nr:hypothetical protein CEXT_191221 [Caerostris extrusa]